MRSLISKSVLALGCDGAPPVMKTARGPAGPGRRMRYMTARYASQTAASAVSGRLHCCRGYYNVVVHSAASYRPAIRAEGSAWLNDLFARFLNVRWTGQEECKTQRMEVGGIVTLRQSREMYGNIG